MCVCPCLRLCVRVRARVYACVRVVVLRACVRVHPRVAVPGDDVPLWLSHHTLAVAAHAQHVVRTVRPNRIESPSVESLALFPKTPVLPIPFPRTVSPARVRACVCVSLRCVHTPSCVRRYVRASLRASVSVRATVRPLVCACACEAAGAFERVQ